MIRNTILIIAICCWAPILKGQTCTAPQDLTVFNTPANVFGSIAPGVKLAFNEINTNSTKVIAGTQVIFRAGNRIEITGNVAFPFVADGNFIARAGGDICDLSTYNFIGPTNSSLQSQIQYSLVADQDDFLLSIQPNEQIMLKIKLVDISGNEVQTVLGQQQLQSDNYEFNILRENLSSGDYKLIIESNGEEIQEMITF